MPHMVNTFGCKDCGHEFEDLWTKPVDEDTRTAWKGRVECPECQSKNLKILVSSSGIAEFSIKDRDAQAASLKKRSLEHSKKLMKQNMDKHRATIQGKMDALKG